MLEPGFQGHEARDRGSLRRDLDQAAEDRLDSSRTEVYFFFFFCKGGSIFTLMTKVLLGLY